MKNMYGLTIGTSCKHGCCEYKAYGVVQIPELVTITGALMKYTEKRKKKWEKNQRKLGIFHLKF